MPELISQKPKVELLAHTANPFDLAVASARTCYSSELVYPDSVTDVQRERIGAAIFEAGHHTPFQHPTFVFAIKDVSRQCVWSFLHAHPFFNSEQQSQRYVVMDSAKVFVPELDNENKKIYEDAVLSAWKAYDSISELLKEDNFKLMENLGRIKGEDEKKIRIESEKKAIEHGRYVLPVCASSTLYHTISGITLHRYMMMVNACDCPTEAKMLVDQMVSEIRKVDPEFVDGIGDGVEENIIENISLDPDPNFAENFDKELDGRISKLVTYDKDAEKLVADSVREVSGAKVSDDEAIALVLDPEKNRYFLSSVNVYSHSPLMRVLNHVNYTFKKKISHTADSQDQRHRMTPASRPLLTRVHTEKPDYVLPWIIERNEAATKLYKETMEMLWDAKNRLIANGVSAENACYLLPNAVNVRFTQTGSLLNLVHKWRLRTCFNAQTEIYDSSLSELRQVAEVHPRLAKYLGPPCLIRFRAGEKENPCPEGPRWCGISVWLSFP
ncbi:FAD-dependent thymidylate synthase, partial [Patescibacteria group bacterium]|nr:FAD-dependent thymidylate synthase [Patescibacteria group bacterium]